MAFLRINGEVVPVADETAEYVPEDIGLRERSFSGRMLTDRRARKRNWTVQTIPLTEQRAKALEGSVSGLGDGIGFDFTTTARVGGCVPSHDFDTLKGLQPTSSPTGANIGIASDGLQVVDHLNLPVAKFGSGFLNGYFSLTGNLLGTDAANCEGGITGLATVGGAAIAQDLTRSVDGGASCRVTVAGAGDGVDFAPGVLFPSAVLSTAWSVHVRTDVTQTMQMFSFTTGLIPSIRSFTWTANPGVWYHVSMEYPVGMNVGTDPIALQILSLNGTGDFNIDTSSVHVIPIILNPTIENGKFIPFFNPGCALLSTYVFDNIQDILTGAQDMTISFWFRGRGVTTHTSGDSTVFRFRDSAGSGFNEIEMNRIVLTDTLRFRTRGDTNTTPVDLSFTPTLDDDYHHIAFVWRTATEGIEVNTSIYYDGVLQVSGDVPTGPDVIDVKKVAMLRLGEDTLGDLIDDFNILPWAATSEQILGWSQMTEPLTIRPRFLVDGDISADADLAVTCEGVANKAKYVVGAGPDGTIRNNLRELDIDIMEV